MSEFSILLSLIRYVLPVEIVDFFDLVDLQEKEGVLYLYLDECNILPDEYEGLSLILF